MSHILLPLTREKQIGVIAKRPIATAAWKPEDQQEGPGSNPTPNAWPPWA